MVPRARGVEPVLLEMRHEEVHEVFSRDKGQGCRSHLTTYTEDQTGHAVIVKMCHVKMVTVSVQ